MVLEVYEAEAQTVVDPNARMEQLADGHTLYITASTSVYRLRCQVSGTLAWKGN